MNTAFGSPLLAGQMRTIAGNENNVTIKPNRRLFIRHDDRDQNENAQIRHKWNGNQIFKPDRKQRQREVDRMAKAERKFHG